MAKNKKRKSRKKNIKQFNIPEMYVNDLEDLNEIIRRLKKDYIKVIFKAVQETGAEMPQICVMLFKSKSYGFDPNYIHGVFITHFVNPENPNDQVIMSIQKEPFIIRFTEKDSITPLKMSFLDKNINNAVMLTFTEKKEIIDGEIFTFIGEGRPVFNYFRDVRFFQNFDPLDHGYIPYILSSKHLGFKIVQDL